jgi:hypothetical protein
MASGASARAGFRDKLAFPWVARALAAGRRETAMALSKQIFSIPPISGRLNLKPDRGGIMVFIPLGGGIHSVRIDRS